jgi:hypothetical protein
MDGDCGDELRGGILIRLLTDSPVFDAMIIKIGVHAFFGSGYRSPMSNQVYLLGLTMALSFHIFAETT